MRLIDADALMDELEDEKPERWPNSPFEVQEQEDWEHFYGKGGADMRRRDNNGC